MEKESKINYEKAIQYFEKAGNNGNSDALNNLGSIYENGKVIAGTMDDERKNILNSYELMKNGVNKGGFSIDNTTIGIVATNAKLDKAQCKKVSQMAHNGYAKAIFPIHTPHDGDTIFTISTAFLGTINSQQAATE